MSGLLHFDVLPEGVDRLRPSSLAKDAWLVVCRHANVEPRSEPTPSGATFCPICKGDEKTTGGYSWPVQLIVVVPELTPELAQAALF